MSDEAKGHEERASRLSQDAYQANEIGFLNVQQKRALDTRIAAALRSAEESAAQRCAEIIESYCGKDHSPHEACWRYVYAHEGGEKIRAEFGLGEEGA